MLLSTFVWTRFKWVFRIASHVASNFIVPYFYPKSILADLDRAEGQRISVYFCHRYFADAKDDQKRETRLQIREELNQYHSPSSAIMFILVSLQRPFLILLGTLQRLRQSIST